MPRSSDEPPGARPSRVERILRDCGAYLEGHFLLTSGRHSPAYVEKFRLLEQPAYTRRLCRLIARRFKDDNVQVVAAPTTGGIILSYEVARQLGVRGIFAEKGEDGRRRFGRGFRIEPGQRVLVVDDVLTTGGSVTEVIEAVRQAGGKLVGVGLLVDRTGGRADFGVPTFACLTLELPSYAPEACPLCARNVPLVVT
ncbi:MAG: orotate phosphoribosyltransferase [Chloroflexi bacterium]|nr:orotate phosphoribosyltransferase [Chloroflexota bacterium]